MNGHGNTRGAMHSFCERTNAGEAESAQLGARLIRSRNMRNAKCAAAKHSSRTCDDCRDADREALLARYREAGREADALLKGRDLSVPIVSPPVAHVEPPRNSELDPLALLKLRMAMQLALLKLQR